MVFFILFAMLIAGLSVDYVKSTKNRERGKVSGIEGVSYLWKMRRAG